MSQSDRLILTQKPRKTRVTVETSNSEKFLMCVHETLGKGKTPVAPVVELLLLLILRLKQSKI